MSKHRQAVMTAFPARLTDAEWAVLEPLIPPNRPGGRPPKHPRRAILDAIVYVVRQGVTWRALPRDFPHWNTAFWYFQEWQKDARGAGSRTPCGGRCGPPRAARRRRRRVWRTARRSGRPSSPAPAGSTGGKRVTGVKRHAVVDTTGLVWGLAVTAADVPDARGARAAVREARAASGERLTHLWADSAYRGLLAFCWVLFDMTVQVVTRRAGAVGFEVQPRRWVVERTFGWLTRWRRLNRNYEHTLASSKAVVQVALIGIMARRLAKTNRR